MITATNEPAHPPSLTRGPTGGTAADPPHPQVALLSNGSYSIVVTDSGAGASTWRGLDVTRWREDAARDCWGQFCYIRELTDGTAWSAGYQPLCRAGEEYQVAFHADRVEFRRRGSEG